MTHADLCAIAVRWLKRPPSAGGHGCIVAVSEPRPEGTGECPDAIGFRAGWNAGSVLVECKTSRADFIADRNKPHRQPGCGMGTWRYYMTPAGLLTAEDMPQYWGLLEVNARGHVKAIKGPAALAKGPHDAYVKALASFAHETSDVELERTLLVRLLARLGDVEAMNLRIREVVSSQNRMARELEVARKSARNAQRKLLAMRNRIESAPALRLDAKSLVEAMRAPGALGRRKDAAETAMGSAFDLKSTLLRAGLPAAAKSVRLVVEDGAVST